MTPGLGPRPAGKLLSEFGSPGDGFRASLTELEACHLTSAPRRAIQSEHAHKDAETEFVQARKLGSRPLNWGGPEYPQRLQEIYDPPPLLYVRGDAGRLNRRSIWIVRTCRPTPYGIQGAERLGHGLAERGLTVISGMARGIDRLAHQGACCASHGAPVGLLGTRADVFDPKENKKIFAEVEKRWAFPRAWASVSPQIS